MAERKYTPAGGIGQDIRSGLSSLYNYTIGNIKDVPRKAQLLLEEYKSNPIYNRYPQLLLNPTNIPLAAAKAGVEALGGVANVPINLSDNVLTQEEPEPPEPEPTLANRDLLSEYYGGFDNVPVRKAKAVKQEAQKLYRVMYAGKGADKSEVYETKEEADAALKKAGGKGAVAGINFSQQQKPGTKAKVFNRNYLMGRLGEELPADETESRKQKYIDQLNKSKSDKKSYEDNLKRIKSPEYRAERQERSRLANEAKRIKDKAEGAKFDKWRSNVEAVREAEGSLNDYNKQLGLLKSAYSQARQANDPLAAYQIGEYINEYQREIPKEMGARKRYAESGALRQRNEMLRNKMEEARIQAEKERRIYATNPDYKR